MNNFPFENLTDTQFEDLVIRVCKEILGIGCKTFSTGRDGAKDSWFTGTAQYFPSTASPWSGTFCIQAKHTTILNSSCSDNDFSVNTTSIISKEIKRLKEEIKENPFQNYIIFTNRKLSGEKVSLIKRLKDEIGVLEADIIGREQLNTYLNDFPQIANQFGLHKFIAPLRFFEKDLKEVIIVFADQTKDIAKEADDFIKNFSVVDKNKKNELNNLSKDYFDFINTHSLSYFKQIESFLFEPRNAKYTGMYSRTVSDLQAKIILERDRFTDFMHLIEHLVEFVVQNNPTELKDLRDKVRVFIHFMYFNCDIGKSI